MTRSLLQAVQTAATLSREVLVSFSGGKDSICVLDLCAQHFERVEAFFMYQVKGLSFQEALLRHYEGRYGITIHRIPHFMLADMMRYGALRLPDASVRPVEVAETYAHVRKLTGIEWIAGGERIADSIWRRAQLKASGGSIDRKRKRLYPIIEWRKKDVLAYLKLRQLPLGADSRVLGYSFRGLDGCDLVKIKQHWPGDYARILRWFPRAEAEVKRYEFYKQQQAE